MRPVLLAGLVLLTLIPAVYGEDEPHPDIAFLTVEQAKAAIIDESVEPYFSLLQRQEMSSKTGAAMTGQTLDEQRSVCRKRYQAAVVAFTPAEQAAVTAVVTAVHALIVEDYPLFAAEPWRFIKIKTDIEGGMPHTRGHCIVFSDAVLPMYLHGDGKTPNPAGVQLLVHEQCHVVQRLHPKPFALLYTDSWGFVRMPHEPKPTPNLIKHQLVNPDGIACVWAFPITQHGTTTLIEPQVIFGSDDEVPAMPNDFSTIALTVEKHGNDFSYLIGKDSNPESVPLESLPEYMTAFAPSQENFHPNEICAELFSRMVTMDMFGKRPTETPCTTKLRTWAKTHLIAK